ncbi:MAG TPA: hypothetical protein VFQ60_01980 [Patescibacteria group bacterium]|nr:hypothetical protein [Patescibacteria group bacterium]
MKQKSHRLEWVSLLYLTFFVLAVLSPSLITRGFFGFSEVRLEELTIFFFGMAGLVTFTVYERLMERREKEREEVQNEYQKAKAELINSYAYIGSVNRKIELLKKFTNEASLAPLGTVRVPKELFSALAANACSAVGAEAAMIRFLELSKLRTEREFFHQADAAVVFRVPNRELRALHEKGLSHGIVRAEDGQQILAIPSDRMQDCKAYLLLSFPEQGLQDLDTSLLKVFVNQAEMLYNNFCGRKNEPLAPAQGELDRIPAEAALPKEL